MTISSINEIKNPIQSKLTPIKEKQDIYIPGIVNQNIPNRNGMISIFSGSGGSGKTSLMLNMFKNKDMYRNRFNNIFYICPMSSFLSVKSHPFENHDKVYHELTVALLEEIYVTLISLKTDKEDKKKNKKNKKEHDKFIDDEEDELVEEEDEEDEIKYSCVIIDDFADSLKDVQIQKQLNKMLIKARHLCCSFIFTLQSYFYFPKILRKQISNIIIFKPKNVEEWSTLSGEIMNLNKMDAMMLFDYVYDENYNHLDIDTVLSKYYKNFNLLQFKK